MKINSIKNIAHTACQRCISKEIAGGAFQISSNNRRLGSYASIEKPVTTAALCQGVRDEFQVLPIKVTSKSR